MNYFETIKCDDNEVYNIHYHEKRIANTIGKNINLLEYIYPPNDHLLKCKVIYSQDEVIDVSFVLYNKRHLKTFQIIIDDTINYKYKYENRQHINNLFLKKDTLLLKVSSESLGSLVIATKGVKLGFFISPSYRLSQFHF